MNKKLIIYQTELYALHPYSKENHRMLENTISVNKKILVTS